MDNRGISHCNNDTSNISRIRMDIFVKDFKGEKKMKCPKCNCTNNQRDIMVYEFWEKDDWGFYIISILFALVIGAWGGNCIRIG